MTEFIVVTWTMIKAQMERHEESIKKNMDYWRKNAKRFKRCTIKWHDFAPE